MAKAGATLTPASDDTAELIYTVPDGEVLTINRLVVTNITSTNVTGIKVNIAQDGGAAANGNLIIPNATVTALNTKALDVGSINVETGGKIYVTAGTAASVNFTLSGNTSEQLAALS